MAHDKHDDGDENELSRFEEEEETGGEREEGLEEEGAKGEESQKKEEGEKIKENKKGEAEEEEQSFCPAEEGVEEARKAPQEALGAARIPGPGEFLPGPFFLARFTPRPVRGCAASARSNEVSRDRASAVPTLHGYPQQLNRRASAVCAVGNRLCVRAQQVGTALGLEGDVGDASDD